MGFIYAALPHTRFDRGKTLNTIFTPEPLSDFLYQLVYPKIKPHYVLDPACGIGNLLKPWSKKCSVIGVEKDADFIIKAARSMSGTWFHKEFEVCTEDQFPVIDLVVANPPWNGHPRRWNYPEVFFRKLLLLFGPTVPMIWICPMGFFLNQTMVSKRWRMIRDSGIKVAGILSLPKNIFPRTEFHSEIIFFNIPKLPPHQFLPESVINTIQAFWDQ